MRGTAVIAILSLTSCASREMRPAAWYFTADPCVTAVYRTPTTLVYRPGTVVRGIDHRGQKTSDWYCLPLPQDMTP